MSYTYLFEPRARDEYREAIKWYGEQSPSAAEKFVSAVSDKLQAICTSPTFYRNTKGDFREAKMSRFPYLIIFRIDPSVQVVVIISVFHQRRDRHKKYK